MTLVAPPAGMNTAVICPESLKISYAPQPLSTCRWAMATGKSGVVDQPRRRALGWVAGGVQLSAAGSVTHEPPVVVSALVLQEVPSVGFSASSKVSGTADSELDEPPPPLETLNAWPKLKPREVKFICPGPVIVKTMETCVIAEVSVQPKEDPSSTSVGTPPPVMVTSVEAEIKLFSTLTYWHVPAF